MRRGGGDWRHQAPCRNFGRVVTAVAEGGQAVPKGWDASWRAFQEARQGARFEQRRLPQSGPPTTGEALIRSRPASVRILFIRPPHAHGPRRVYVPPGPARSIPGRGRRRQGPRARRRGPPGRLPRGSVRLGGRPGDDGRGLALGRLDGAVGPARSRHRQAQLRGDRSGALHRGHVSAGSARGRRRSANLFRGARRARHAGSGGQGAQPARSRRRPHPVGQRRA